MIEGASPVIILGRRMQHVKFEAGAVNQGTGWANVTQNSKSSPLFKFKTVRVCEF